MYLDNKRHFTSEVGEDLCLPVTKLLKTTTTILCTG